MRALHSSSPLGWERLRIRTGLNPKRGLQGKTEDRRDRFSSLALRGALGPSQSSQKRRSEGAALVRPLFGQKTAPGAS
jgi:hypothetical protein